MQAVYPSKRICVKQPPAIECDPSPPYIQRKCDALEATHGTDVYESPLMGEYTMDGYDTARAFAIKVYLANMLWHKVGEKFEFYANVIKQGVKAHFSEKQRIFLDGKAKDTQMTITCCPLERRGCWLNWCEAPDSKGMAEVPIRVHIVSTKSGFEVDQVRENARLCRATPHQSIGCDILGSILADSFRRGGVQSIHELCVAIGGPSAAVRTTTQRIMRRHLPNAGDEVKGLHI